ncbi:MAG: hypothetical protein EVA68_06450 [OM182 bacterium]|uniref:Alpha/beta hydrolase n=1 Tax=OM182 bacterium TaxID=2510334 RepID=A0A520RZM0_9GAMM|nr:MAG: hypothetical protein EVA68_06450 [OM182 bacterium]
MSSSSTIIMICVLLAVSFCFWRIGKPRLEPESPKSNVPKHLSLMELKSWLKSRETEVSCLMPEVEANITWAEPSNPQRTKLCFLYIHGFSATPRETSPLTEQISDRFSANYMHARLAGHGIKNDIDATAEEWLQSIVDSWDIAQQIGENVVIIATSTGATLTVWLANQLLTTERIYAAIFLAPNFRARHPLDTPIFSISSILTWPWSEYWIPLLLGKRRELNFQNDLEEQFSTHGYSVKALIEMQKTVDWSRTVDYGRLDIPLCTMYMKNDPTIDSYAAIKVHEEWGSNQKELIPVTLNENSIEHVFVGDIMAPHRTDWCTERLALFLRGLEKL